ncbi:MAG: hypothetical protein JNJ77_10950 [Planctomycetia bacterium]|nr:hypothetical protein [Planctomycetia bacterium]
MYPSGLWRGFWEQQYFGRQFMDDFTLKFHNGSISGGGKDIVGLFVIKGEYDQGQISFVKQYIGKHKVVYTGQYDGEGSIHGTWVIPGDSKGPFSLSPSPYQAKADDPIQEIG